MPNMNSYISKHNNKILSQNLQQNLSNKTLAERGIPHCNCQNKATCVMPGKCVNSNMVYRFSVKRSDNQTTETYTGCTWNFKQRHDKHMRSFNNNTGSTTLTTRPSGIITSHMTSVGTSLSMLHHSTLPPGGAGSVYWKVIISFLNLGEPHSTRGLNFFHTAIIKNLNF